ncbi:hypothetical protein SAMN05660690_1239 [Geodermatophilus telluris]|uniref:Uncharacterized protein n=1 Tax=Geodermatophilus telluris TaxID=1190417 RepID=A0A1G6L8U1_9ACTN|nr:hypothetical protein [Geodermatophilus telluris]SDC39205.1 hypothetical protein SAMN05660690_1239 [Geodermatophilus telluris]
MAFLLGSTWLALTVLVAEHGPVLLVAALCGVGPARTALRHVVA